MQHERRWLAVSAIGFLLFAASLDATIVALALPQIAQFFHIPNSLASVVSLASAIPLAILTIPAGDLVSRFRVLPTFTIAISGYILGSIVCGLAPGFEILLVGRVIQGCFSAVLATMGFAVAAAVVSDSERGRAMGLIGAIAPIGGIIGPVIGGLLLANFGWSSIFFASVPFCILAILLGIYSLRGVRLGEGERQQSNVFRHMGTLLRRTPFLWGLLAFFSSVTTVVALFYVLPFNLESVQHIDLSVAGFVFLCVPLGMGAMGIVGGFLADRYGARPVMLTGSGLFFIGVLLMTLTIQVPTSPFDLGWRLLIVGIGIGLFTGPNQARLMSIGTRETMGAASALTNLGSLSASICGPLVISLSWALLTDISTQMLGGMLLVCGFALLNFLFVWLAVGRKTLNVQSEAEPELASEEGSPVKAG